jgi:hypothetical protein
MNMKIELFDSITGGVDGSASVDGWEEMTLDELQEQVDSHNEHYYQNRASSEECHQAALHVYFSQRSHSFNDIRDNLKG